MKERIRLLRKALGLSQEKMGNRIGLTGGAIANYERGTSVPLNSVIAAICKEFRVSEEWLNTGAGEMFLPEGDEIDALAAAYPNLTPESLEFIRKFSELPKEVQDGIWGFMRGLLASFGVPDPAAGAADRVPQEAAGVSDRVPQDAAGGADREPVVLVQPSKPVSEMSEDEIVDLVRQQHRLEKDTETDGGKRSPAL